MGAPESCTDEVELKQTGFSFKLPELGDRDVFLKTEVA